MIQNEQATSASHYDDFCLKLLHARLIKEALARNGWNRLAAARELGIHKTTLHRRIRRLGIELPSVDGRSSARRKPPA